MIYRNFSSLLHRLTTTLTVFGIYSTAFSQNSTDLSITFDTTPPSFVEIGDVFSIQATVNHEGNSSAVVGETVTATLELKDPYGNIIFSHAQSWDGFSNPAPPENRLDNTANNIGQVSIQMPWTESQKWFIGADEIPYNNDDNNWTLVASVSSPSLESNLVNNSVQHYIYIQVPDLTIENNLQIRSKDPISGQLSPTIYPGDRIQVNGLLSNIGSAMTQPGIRFQVEARLYAGNVVATNPISRALSVDFESVALPVSDGSTQTAILPGAQVPFEINDLQVPDDAQGTYTIQLIADLPEGENYIQPIGDLIEEFNENNNHVGINFTVTQGTADLKVSPSSFQGDVGSFNGLDPIRISFAVRNEGNGVVRENDSYLLRVALSTDDSFSTDDYLLREFDLSGDALGANLLPNETINLDWVQQLPDNFEGDYYLLASMLDIDYIFQNTPSITLTSLNRGTSSFVESNGTEQERPSTSFDGNIVAYERSVSGVKQIFFKDVRDSSNPVAVTNGNDHSLSPRVSGDGNVIVFHSRASDLVPGDTNGHEDIFVYYINSGKTDRATNFAKNEQGNGGSFYPCVSHDGSYIAFESEATNLTSSVTTGKEIFLWNRSVASYGTISLLTNGNGDSRTSSISSDGNRVVFSSDATDLISGETDTNGNADIFLYDNTTKLTSRINKSIFGLEASGGFSDQPKISGDGSTLVFRSLATNLVSNKGVSLLTVEKSGVGYMGNPGLFINDPYGNGEGAEIAFMDDAIDLYGQIKPGGIQLVSAGKNYTDPKVTITPDPNFPAPTQIASIKAHLTHPLGEIYSVNLNNFLSGDYSTIRRVSENESGVGGDLPSREPAVSSDGTKIVYSTQASNLLTDQISRADGKIFSNNLIKHAKAQAVVVGGIGEIEILTSGQGYSNGFLAINDFSGAGTGAVASYEVDSSGRITSINMINHGSNYNFNSTSVQVDNPRGGTGFSAGTLRLVKEIGLGAARTGGGKIHRIEMIEHGLNYHQSAVTTLGLDSLIAIDGDGVDSDGDGKPDAKINPDRIKIDSLGGVYLEQKFDLEIISTAGLLSTTLRIEDANKSIPITFASSDSLPLTIGINGRTLSQIRDQITSVILDQWNYDLWQHPDPLFDGPQIENNATGGRTFTLSALSGKVILNNTSSILVTAQSNMLFSGFGFTRATPYIAPPPTIHGFSEISPATTFIQSGDGRQLYASQKDVLTDDIYLFDSTTGKNERVSLSTFGFPTNYIGSSSTNMPSNRFPSLSGNGRFVVFSTDASGNGSLVFNGSNQIPVDTNTNREIILRDRKASSLPSVISGSGVNVLFPRNDLNESFSVQSVVPVIADFELAPELAGLTYGIVMLDNEFIGLMTQHGVTNSIDPQNDDYLSHRFTFSIIPRFTSVGTHTVQVLIFKKGGQTPIASSEIVDFKIADFAELTPELILNNLPYENITSTSTLLISATGRDLDADFKGVTFYLDGKSLDTEEPRKPQTTQPNVSYFHYYEANQTGVFTVHAMGRDNSGNLVITDPKTFMVTNGTPRSEVKNPEDIKSFRLKSPDILADINGTDGSIRSIKLLAYPNHQFIGKPNITVLGEGNVALVEAILDSNSTGNLIGFNITNGGSGYKLDNLELQVTQTRRVIRVGTPAEITTRWKELDGGQNDWLTEAEVSVYLREQAFALEQRALATEMNASDPFNPFIIGSPFFFSNSSFVFREDGITYYDIKRRFDGTALSGEGYMVAPKWQPVLEFEEGAGVITLDRLPLNPPVNGSSNLAEFSRQWEGIVAKGIIKGGFTRSPVYLVAEPTLNDKNIESVSLFVDGILDDTSVDKKYPYTLSFIADEAQSINLSFAVKDYDGNIFFTRPDELLIKEHYGSGVLASFSETNATNELSSAVQIGSDNIFSVEASSAYDIQEVEFYIDGVSVGFGKDIGDGRFTYIEDFSEYAQGDHLLSFVARDSFGNEVGTFDPAITNIEQFKHKKITVVPSVVSHSPSIFPLPRMQNNVVPTISVKRGVPVVINTSASTDRDEKPYRIYLLADGTKLRSTNGEYFVSYDENSTLHQNGIFSFEFIPESEGNYTLLPMIIDTAGQQKFSTESISMNVVNNVTSAPQVSMVFPQSNIAISRHSKMRFVASANHTDGSLVGVQFYLNGFKYGDFQFYEKDKPKDGIFYTIDLEPPYTQDVNIVTASALDTSGNENFAPAVIVTLTPGDEKIPQIQLDPLNPSYSENQSLFLSATVSDFADSSSGQGVVEEVSFVINGQVERIFTQPPYFWIWDANSSGLYNIFVMARDNEGNVAVSNTYTTQIGELYGEQKPVLGSITPNILGQVKIYDGVQQVQVSGSQRRIAETNEVEKTTIIQGLSTKFLSQLYAGQIVRFANGDQLSSKSYVILEITDDETLKLKGEMNAEDLALLSGWSNLQFFNVYRVGSLIPLNLNSNINDDSYVAVEFYENGNLIERDMTWPFSSAFVPTIEGNYSIAVVAESVTGEQSLYTERIEVLPKLGFLPDGSTAILPDLTRRGSTTIGSELIFVANYDDSDSGMNRVEFYLNGDLIHIDREKPFYCKFKPLSDSDIYAADRTWELTAVGVDNDQNRVAFGEVGTVQSSVLLPTAEIKVPLNGAEYAHEQSIKIRVDIKGNNLESLLGRGANVVNPNANLTPRQMNIMGNGEFICVAQESAWGSGIFLADWVCDQNLAGESDTIEIIGAIVMEDENVGGLPFTPSILTDIVTISVVEPNLSGDPKAVVNQTYQDLLGKSASEQEVNSAITEDMEASSSYLFENDDFLRWAAHISEKAIFQNMVNAIAGYHIMVGEYPDYLKIREIMDTYSAIPNYGQDGSADVDGDGFSLRQENLFRTSDQDAADFPDSAFSMGSFVDDTLSSRDFTDNHDQVPPLTPPATGNDRFTNYDENRRLFVRLIYKNKYGINPTFIQEREGAYRISVFDPNSQEAQRDQQMMMMQQMSMYSNFGFGGVGGGGGRGGGGGNINPFAALLGNTNTQDPGQTPATFRNGEPAVLFVVNMILEKKINNQKMIYGAPNKRDYYNTAALISSFWQENLGVMSDELIAGFHGMSTEKIISNLMRDSRYSDRFGGLSISKDAKEVENAPGWKYLAWLGYYNDKRFPWIFHSQLGWMYVHSPDGKQAWLFIPELGWFWTTELVWANRNPEWILWLYEKEKSRWIGYYTFTPLGKQLLSEGRTFWDPQTQSDFTFE